MEQLCERLPGSICLHTIRQTTHRSAPPYHLAHLAHLTPLRVCERKCDWCVCARTPVDMCACLCFDLQNHNKACVCACNPRSDIYTTHTHAPGSTNPPHATPPHTVKYRSAQESAHIRHETLTIYTTIMQRNIITRTVILPCLPYYT